MLADKRDGTMKAKSGGQSSRSKDTIAPVPRREEIDLLAFARLDLRGGERKACSRGLDHYGPLTEKDRETTVSSHQATRKTQQVSVSTMGYLLQALSLSLKLLSMRYYRPHSNLSSSHGYAPAAAPVHRPPAS